MLVIAKLGDILKLLDAVLECNSLYDFSQLNDSIQFAHFFFAGIISV